VRSLLRRLWNAKWRLVAVLVGAYAVYLAWYTYSFTLQIRNTLMLIDYSDEVAALRDRAERLPASFDGRKDYYGHDIIYIQDDDHYMLVSYGSDGKPDRTDYATLLHVSVEPGRNSLDGSKRHNNCALPSWDTVIVNRDVWQGCGK
jgi:hypothetical protein